MIWYYELIFAIAEILLSSWTFVQAYQVYKTGQTRDINLLAFSLLWLGTLALFVGGCMITSYAMMFFNFVCLFVVGYIWYSKYVDQPVNYHLLSEFFDQKTTNNR